MTKGTEILIQVGKGKDAVTVPAFTNQARAAVKAALEAAGLKVVEKEEYSDTIVAGNVIKLLNASGKEVNAGDELKYGTELTMVVSKGVEVVEYTTSTTVDIPGGAVKATAILTYGNGKIVEQTDIAVSGSELTVTFDGITDVKEGDKGKIEIIFYKVKEAQGGSDGEPSGGEGTENSGETGVEYEEIRLPKITVTFTKK